MLYKMRYCACKDPDGLYQLRGRKDDMIIRAGMNIYPAEIEAALKTDPRVAQALAYGFNGVGGGTQIGLKIAGTFSTQAEIIALCRTLLPEYEQPARIQLVEELPRNGSGKIKRN